MLTNILTPTQTAAWIIIGVIALLLVVRAYIILPFFTKKGKVIRRLKKRGSFPHWKEIDVRVGEIVVTWFHGYRNNPEAVEVYSFDYKNQICTHEVNTDHGTRKIFSGSLEEGLAIYAPSK